MALGGKGMGETKVSFIEVESQYTVSKIGKSRNSSISIVFRNMATFTNEK